MTDTRPQGWTTEDARRDPSWIQRLGADEVAGFDAALAHAKATARPWLQRGRCEARLLGHGPEHRRGAHAEPASQTMNDVRDEGAAYKAANGRSRGYNTKAGLDFHMDSADIVGLLCRRARLP